MAAAATNVQLKIYPLYHPLPHGHVPAANKLVPDCSSTMPASTEAMSKSNAGSSVGITPGTNACSGAGPRPGPRPRAVAGHCGGAGGARSRLLLLLLLPLLLLLLPGPRCEECGGAWIQPTPPMPTRGEKPATPLSKRGSTRLLRIVPIATATAAER